MAQTSPAESAMEALQVADVNKIIEFLQTDGLAFGIDVVLALLIFFVGRFAVRMLVRMIRKGMQKNSVEKTLETFVCNLVNSALLIVVIIAAIGQIGIQTTSFIAIFGAAGLAIGLALQGSLSNFASGVLIVLFRPYKVGDFVEAAGIAGVVEQVQILTTVLKTGDNKQVIVPNSQIMDSIITNYSANNTRRVDMVIGVSYDDDLDKVRKTLEEIIAADDRVLKDPEPKIAVSELADSSVNFIVRPWVATADYWAVMWDMTEVIKKRFDKDGISFPFPHCAEPDEVSPIHFRDVGFDDDMIDTVQAMKGRGCEQCHMTGYKGRMALFETLPILERLHDKILSRASTSELKACARQEGFRTLRQAGLVAIQQGQTTMSEILTETNDDGSAAIRTKGL